MTIKNLYPTQRPALDLNFANSKRLDPRVSLTRASTATYVGSDGLIKTAAAGEARFDHDPVTGESLGLLIEESRTNLLTRSEEFDNAAWFKTGGTVTPNTASAPDSTLTADTLAYSGVNRIAVERNTLASTISGTTYTTSIFVKVAGGDARYVQLWNHIGASGAFANFDIIAGTLGSSSSNAAPFIQKLPNNWYRVGFVAVSNASIWYPCVSVVDSASASRNGNYSGSTASIYIWGAQLEASPYATSYIPTSGSTVTRAADVASLTNTGVYDTDSFTILNDPYGAAGGGSTLSIVGGGQTPVKRTTVYNQDLSQAQINSSVGKFDEFWRWRILGSSFALPNFSTDGQVTVDWGDGTVETLTTSEHTFTDGGGYHDVGFRLDSGTYFAPAINDNATHKDKVIALGPAPESIKLNVINSFNGCANLEAFDATVDATGGNNFYQAWRNCSSLTSFPLIDTSSGTNFQITWFNCSSLTNFPLIDTSSGTNFARTWQNCSSLTSFPLIDTSSGTNFAYTWASCSSLTSFPLIDTSSGTSFGNAWNGCSSLTSFPLIDASNVTSFQYAWQNCSSLTSFPLIDTSSGTNFSSTWRDCSSLTSFPLIDTSSGTNFGNAWANDSSLTDFPANFFDSWTGTPANSCFAGAWNNCSSLTATSVENILNSIDTSGQSAPASGVDITIDYDAGTGTPSVSTAVTNLKSRGWTITLNGVAQ